MTKLEHFMREYQRELTRRWFFKQCGVGLGSIALASLLGDQPRAQCCTCGVRAGRPDDSERAALSRPGPNA